MCLQTYPIGITLSDRSDNLFFESVCTCSSQPKCCKLIKRRKPHLCVSNRLDNNHLYLISSLFLKEATCLLEDFHVEAETYHLKMCFVSAQLDRVLDFSCHFPFAYNSFDFTILTLHLWDKNT